LAAGQRGAFISTTVASAPVAQKHGRPTDLKTALCQSTGTGVVAENPPKKMKELAGQWHLPAALYAAEARRPDRPPAAICRSLERLPAPIFVLTRRIGAYRVEMILRAGASILGGAFSLASAMKERAMDDPFRQTRDPRMRAARYQRLARQYFD
jgi:hypothetical protein